MNDIATILKLIAVFAGGVALGVFYFGGLWLTVRLLSNSATTPLLVTASYIARTALVLGGIYWLTGGQWRAVLICIGGMLIARSCIIRRILQPQALVPTRQGGLER